MADSGLRTLVMRLKRKRIIDEEEKRKNLKIIIGITSIMSVIATWYTEKFMVKEPSHDWDQERQSYLKRLYDGSEVDCIEQLRVSKSAFKSLCKVLQEKGGLVQTKQVTIEEAVAMFLHILAHNLKYRVIKFAYYRSKETISRQFNSVLRAMMKISKDYLKYHPCLLSGSDKNKWKWFEVLPKLIYILAYFSCSSRWYINNFFFFFFFNILCDLWMGLIL